MSEDNGKRDTFEGARSLRLTPVRAIRPAAPVVAVEDREAHLTDYLRILHKRRWTMLAVMFGVVLTATVYSFTATPVYEARAKLLIEAENPNVVSFKEVIEQDQARADYYQTQYNLLQSRSLARRTVDALKIGDRLAPPAEAASGGVVTWVSGAVAAAIGSAAAPEPEPGEDEGESAAVDALLKNLTVAPIRNSRIVDLKFQSPDPELATSVVNAHARGYIDQNLEFKFLSTKDATDWLAERLEDQRRAVETAEAALQRYREQNHAIPMGEQENIVVQKLSDLNGAVTRAKTERIEREAVYNQLRAIQNDRAALDTFPAILSNAFIQAQKTELAELQRQHAGLSERLGERHPDIIKVRTSIQTAESKLQGEIEKVVQSVRNQYQAALAQERSLTAALDAQKGEALSMNRKSIEYGVLQREVESTRQIYDSLLQRAKETGVSSELRTSNVRIVDLAETPTDPISPRRGLNILLALLGGAMLGASMAFFLEYADNRLKNPEELKSQLGLPTLGLIPSIPTSVVPSGQTPLINTAVPPNFAEALRTLRTNVLFSSADDGGKSLVVTSTSPGEGKTLVASNLAIAFAQAGQRVLLIDADMRRPRVNEVFSVDQEPGLSNVLVGSAKASEAITQSRIKNLWLLSSGRTPPNPPELLGSQRFRDLLGSLRTHFDWVLIDTPPIMPVSDAALIANIASGVVYVVGAEMTSRYAAQAGLEQLESAKAHLIGAVLNRVDLDKQSFYYSHYYRREYQRYYVNARTTGTATSARAVNAD
jgi:exopolysaccharide transport family protein